MSGMIVGSLHDGSCKSADECVCNPLYIKAARPVRGATVRKGYDPGPDCVVCGYKATNVRHEREPERSPEGPNYYASFLYDLHEFRSRD